MKQAFGLTVVLVGVLVAMFVLKKKASEHAPARGDGGMAAAVPAPPPALPLSDGGSRQGIRVISLTRMIPRYRLAMPTAEPAAVRARILERLAKHRGSPAGVLPEDPRAPFQIEVPEGELKPLLKALRAGREDLRLTSRRPRPTVGPATIEIEVSLPPR
jgi:hypothetical protein